MSGTGYIPPPSAPPLIGWAGQPLVSVPKSGLVLTPGAGMVGRTIGSGLFLDNTRTVASEIVSLFVPGLLTAKTLGKWRNRRANAKGTLTVMEAQLLTVGTTGDGANMYRLVATDAAGSNAVMPISFPLGQSFYDLNQIAGSKVCDPWTGTTAGAWGNVLGLRFPLVPSQSFDIGGVITTGWAVVDNAGNNKVVPTRCQLWRQSATDPTAYTLMATAYAYGTLTGNNVVGTGASWQFDQVQPVVAGTRYFITFDIFEAYNPPTVNGIQFASAGSGAQQGGQPADCNPASGGDMRLGRAWITQGSSTAAGVNPMTWDQISGATANAALGGNRGTFNNETGIVFQVFTAGKWALSGTVSDVAPFVGDVTFSIATLGAPVSATSGSDLNIRAIISP